MSIAYYNEHDPFAAAWLRELISAGEIADGVVDDRDIQDVCPNELEGYTQCHFFAGIGGWSYALRLAGWPDDKPVWTGSCPCQPFSTAGYRLGYSDHRHLWPEFARLIAECNPTVAFGEQVASKAGRVWLSRVRTDLEDMGYAVGAADLCAAGVSAPHIRQRLYWGAYAASERFDGCQDSPKPPRRNGTKNLCDVRGASYANDGIDKSGCTQRDVGNVEDGAWSAYEGVDTRYGRKFRIKPGLSVLAHGVPARVGRLRGYGNAIVPQVAAAFISAYIDATNTQR